MSMSGDIESQQEAVPHREETNDISDTSAGSVQHDNEEDTKKFTVVNLKHPDTYIDRSYQQRSLEGFLSIIKNIHRSRRSKSIYKIGLFIFFFVTFLYPIIVFIIKREHRTYNIVCSVISLTGLIYQTANTLIFSCIKPWYDNRKTCRAESTPNPSALKKAFQDPEDVKVSEIEDDHVRDLAKPDKVPKPKEAITEFIRDSVGELFIYPSIICSLYGFINERGWKLGSPLAVFDFILLVYGLLTDVFNAKIIHIWNIVQVVRAIYNKYDEKGESDLTTRLCRYLSPFSLAIPYAVIQVLVHWLILAIIGIRIYVDNFTRRINDTRINDTVEIELGDYRTTACTWYMIFCGGYLLVVSIFVYLTLNKYWFFEIYGYITKVQNHEIPLRVKLSAFMRDPVAYILVVLQVVPFIPFALGSFLLDYDHLEFDVGPGLQTAARLLGWCFIGLFVVSNIQAVIICTCLAIVFGIIGYIIALFTLAIAIILLGYLVIILCNCVVLPCNRDQDVSLCSRIPEYTETVISFCTDFWSMIDVDCVVDFIVSNLDWFFCTCHPYTDVD